MLAGCSIGTADEDEERAGAVYEAIVRWLATRDATDADPLPVFVEPRGEGATIKLEVQTELIEKTADVATVRFIDTLDEALVDPEEPDPGETGEPAPGTLTATTTTAPTATTSTVAEGGDEPVVRVVRDGGVLVRLAPVVEAGRRATIDVDVFHDEVSFTTLQFEVVERQDTWRVDGQPQVLATD